MFRKLLIKHRLLLLGGFPTLSVCSFTFYYLYQEIQALSSARNAIVYVEQVQSLNEVITQLQKERGMTAIWISSGGEKYQKELPQQRDMVTKLLAKNEAVLSLINQEHAPLKDDLETIRALSKQADVQVEAVIQGYSRCIGTLLKSCETVAHQSRFPELNQAMLAEVSLISAKESLGLQRAYGGTALNKGAFPGDLLAAYHQTVGARTGALQTFSATCGSALETVLDKVLNSAPESDAGAKETILLANAVDLSAIDLTAEDWFQIKTNQIEVWRDLEAKVTTAMYDLGANEIFWAQSQFLMSSLLTLALLTICTWIYIKTYRSIVGPLDELITATNQIAAGNLEVRILDQGKDEVARLSQNMQQMVKSLRTIIGELKHQSVAMDQNAKSLNHVSEDMVQISKQMNLRTNQVSSNTKESSLHLSSMASSVDQMAKNASSVSKATQNVTNHVGTVAQSLSQLSHSIQGIDSHAKSAIHIAEDAMKLGASADQTMGSLTQAARDISKVTEVIITIAEQTNLLALNANIEAASAGEFGKGFAVVANEIKELANQSASAAEDISRRIDGIQNHSQSALDANQRVTRILSEISKAVVEISQSVSAQNHLATEINHMLADANTNLGHINQSLAEMAIGSQEVTQNIQRVSDAAKRAAGTLVDLQQSAQKTERNAEDLHGSASTLKNLSGAVEQLIGQFRH
ncbi:MAG: methyl-accepting chemotaxis protein [Acidobacteria bacterium]|nr:methyl-accepting chemotaxis protein [Acidobacteriota bacterium]